MCVVLILPLFSTRSICACTVLHTRAAYPRRYTCVHMDTHVSARSMNGPLLFKVEKLIIRYMVLQLHLFD